MQVIRVITKAALAAVPSGTNRLMRLARVATGLGLALAATGLSSPVRAEAQGFLETIHRHSVVTSTIAPNGDQNPYAVLVAPVTSGQDAEGRRAGHQLQQQRNLQGLGTTIVD